MRESDSLASGIDIVEVKRIENIMEKKGDAFLNKIFTRREIEYIHKGGRKATSIAGLFAAKEAISKALGTGIGKLAWRDIEIIHDEKGKPRVNGRDIEISISHEKNYAIALAIKNKEVFTRGIDLEFRKLLPLRSRDSHKGDYGRVGIMGGSKGMTGAPYMASQAALRSGAGLVYTIVPRSLETIMAVKLTEAIVKPIEDEGNSYFLPGHIKDLIRVCQGLDVLALGPGMGYSKDRVEVVKEVVSGYKGPLVIDADGINCLSQVADSLCGRQGPTVITPHPGELARFLGKDLGEIQENRIYYSKYTSAKYNIIVVLKGYETVITSPKGECYINKTGNPGMATAGSGDLLTGMIASFMGQGLIAMDAAKLSVYCHGLAGDMAKFHKGEYGLIATDILDNIPHSIKKIQE